MDPQSEDSKTTEPNPFPRPKRRSRRGCLTCRHRKVKCDERPECCGNCDRLKLECVWESRVGFPTQRVQRSRKSRACTRCRDKKLRCLAVESPEGCRNCIQARVQCATPGERQPNTEHAESLQALSDVGPEKGTLMALLDTFFQGPHRFCFYTFVHRQGYTRMLENNLVPRQLPLIISATALRCQDAESTLPDRWADECRELVLRDVFNRISTANLQTLLLLQRYEWHRGSHLAAWFIAGLAFRLANALQLYQDPSERRGDSNIALPIAVMETRRRLIWSCFVMDTIPDSGDRPFNPATDPKTIKARLPCDEASYELGIDSNPGYFHDPLGDYHHLGRPSISAFLIRMTALRLTTLQYSTSFYPQSKMKPETKAPWEADANFFLLKAQFDNFLTSLPAELSLDHAVTSVDQPFLTSLFTLHVMYHAAYTDLLRIGTHTRLRGDFEGSGCSPPPAFFEFCKKGRLNHASMVASIASMVTKSPCEHHDPFVAICCCLAIRISVVERRYGNQELLDLSNPMVAANLEACRVCVLKTAHWSKPIRRLAFAVSELVSQHGFDLDVSELLSSPDMDLNPVSRAGTPGFTIYGTAANIKKARQDHDLESAESNTDIQHVSPSSIVAPTGGSSVTVSPNIPAAMVGEPIPDQYVMPQRDVMTPERLRIASNWANGVYDAETYFQQMDLADIDLQWSYGFNDANFNSGQAWIVDGIPPPFL